MVSTVAAPVRHQPTPHPLSALLERRPLPVGQLDDPNRARRLLADPTTFGNFDLPELGAQGLPDGWHMEPATGDLTNLLSTLLASTPPLPDSDASYAHAQQLAHHLANQGDDAILPHLENLSKLASQLIERHASAEMPFGQEVYAKLAATLANVVCRFQLQFNQQSSITMQPLWLLAGAYLRQLRVQGTWTDVDEAQAPLDALRQGHVLDLNYAGLDAQSTAFNEDEQAEIGRWERAFSQHGIQSPDQDASIEPPVQVASIRDEITQRLEVLRRVYRLATAYTPPSGPAMIDTTDADGASSETGSNASVLGAFSAHDTELDGEIDAVFDQLQAQDPEDIRHLLPHDVMQQARAALVDRYRRKTERQGYNRAELVQLNKVIMSLVGDQTPLTEDEKNLFRDHALALVFPDHEYNGFIAILGPNGGLKLRLPHDLTSHETTGPTPLSKLTDLQALSHVAGEPLFDVEVIDLNERTQQAHLLPEAIAYLKSVQQNGRVIEVIDEGVVDDGQGLAMTTDWQKMHPVRDVFSALLTRVSNAMDCKAQMENAMKCYRYHQDDDGVVLVEEMALRQKNRTCMERLIRIEQKVGRLAEGLQTHFTNPHMRNEPIQMIVPTLDYLRQLGALRVHQLNTMVRSGMQLSSGEQAFGAKVQALTGRAARVQDLLRQCQKEAPNGLRYRRFQRLLKTSSRLRDYFMVPSTTANVMSDIMDEIVHPNLPEGSIPSTPSNDSDFKRFAERLIGRLIRCDGLFGCDRTLITLIFRLYGCDVCAEFSG